MTRHGLARARDADTRHPETPQHHHTTNTTQKHKTATQHCMTNNEQPTTDKPEATTKQHHTKSKQHTLRARSHTHATTNSQKTARHNTQTTPFGLDTRLGVLRGTRVFHGSPLGFHHGCHYQPRRVRFLVSHVKWIQTAASRHSVCHTL